MAEDFSDEEWERIDKGIAEGAFSPKQLKILSELRLQRANRTAPGPEPGLDIYAPPVPEAPPVREEPAPVAAVRSVWDYGKSLLAGTRPPGTRTRPPTSAYENFVRAYGYGDPMEPSSAIERAKAEYPDKAAEIESGYQGGVQKGGREMIEWMPTILAAVFGPAAVAPGAYTKLAALYREIGYPLIRAAYVYLGQNVAERVANIVDPSHRTDPEKAARSEAAGELIGSVGGRMVDKTAGRVGRALHGAFEETPMGTVRREVIEGLGEHPTLGMVSERYWPRSADVILGQQPFTGHVRNRYEKVNDTLQAELKRHAALYPGTRVTEAGNVLKADIAGRSTPALEHTGPRVLRDTRDQVIRQANTQMDQTFERLDTDYLLRPLNWATGKAQLPPLYGMQDLLLDPALLPQVGADSLFHDVLRLNHALYTLPDTISLASAYDLLKTVRGKTDEVYAHIQDMDRLVQQGVRQASPLTDSLQMKVLPVLGTIENQLNQIVRPYLSDIREAKAWAARLVGAQEQAIPGHFRTSQATLQGGQAARFALMEDPHIQVARDLLLQPDFVKFTDAHQIRSKLLMVARQEGPLIDNVIAEHGQKMADLVFDAMETTSKRLTPELFTHWRMADQIYREAKAVFDSPVMHEFKDMNLDDILTRLVKEERPNDMLLLRETLGKTPAGRDVFDTASQMWLTRQIEQAIERGGGGGRMDVTGLLADVNRVRGPSERILFPSGDLPQVKDLLRRHKWMQDAVTEVGKGGKADALVLAQYKRDLAANPAEWEAVKSDALHHLLTTKGRGVPGQQLLDGILELGDAGKVLLDPAHYDELTRLGHTAAYVERAADRGSLHWNPLIRFGEHALGPTGAVGGGVVTHLLLHNPLLTAGAVAGWVVGSRGLAYLLTQPAMVRLLSQGMTSPISAERAGEIIGLISAQLNNGGYENEMTPVGGPQPGPVAAP